MTLEWCVAIILLGPKSIDSLLIQASYVVLHPFPYLHLQNHLFVPNIESMYGKNYATYIDCQSFDDIPESIVRPGHFRGVATIVTKLFNIVQPTNAYFGQKDAGKPLSAQVELHFLFLDFFPSPKRNLYSGVLGQCVLIRRIVEDLDMDVNVVVGETVRELDGLAMSSRNAYLTDIERPAASIIYKSLCAAKEMWENNPSMGSSELISIVKRVLNSEPLVSEIQYVSVESMATMKAVEKPSDCEFGATISLGCIVGKVRLIDNIALKH